ncbi:MAG: DUF4143 domain-containing protein [bacterium]
MEAKLVRYAVEFPALLILGARQVGKSTLLNHIHGHKAKTFVFDPIVDIGNARQDPDFFLDQNPGPLILDEIQYAPELLPAIKRRIDAQGRMGNYLMIGSQNLALLKNIAESLAGRVIVLELGSMTTVEKNGAVSADSEPWLKTLLAAGGKMPELSGHTRVCKTAKNDSLFDRIWRGGMPITLDKGNERLGDVMSSYLRTYVERDVRIMAQVDDQHLFTRFLSLCAARTAQEINHSQVGREIGITPQTAKRWMALLAATYQWIEIPAYHGNALKKVSERSKGYICDTGLAAHLQYISSPDALAVHPMQGALMETYVVRDILNTFNALARPPKVYHWRRYSGAEVDLILERDGIFWPIEIKSTTRINAKHSEGIRLFRSHHPHLQHGPGVILAPVEQVSCLPENNIIIPYDLV